MLGNIGEFFILDLAILQWCAIEEIHGKFL